MDNSFFAYMQQLELMAFFSGYPLIYAVMHFIAGNEKIKDNFWRRSASLLPFSYALLGTLYLGLQLKNLHPGYSIENIKNTVQQPGLMIWGLLAIIFWLPALARKTVLSLLHSLIFFFFLAKDLIVQSSASSPNNDIVKNDMKIYTDSLLLNVGALILILLVSFIFRRYKKSFIF